MLDKKGFLLALALLLALFAWGMEGCSRPYDVLVLGGTVLDGTGSDSFRADVGIRGGKIVAIGELAGARARQTVHVDGLVVCPGFIDIHTHAERELLRYPDVPNYVRQGVTTVIGGNCGSSPLPIGRYLSRVESVGVAVNIGLLVGHNTVRRRVMDAENRQPRPDELERMKQLVEAAMRDGAFGMSTGLKYIPGAYARTEEVVELAKVVAQFGGIYATHMRDEGRRLFASIREAIAIGKAAGLPVEISHFKAVGRPMWGSAPRMLAMIDSARKAGIDVTFDQYPYTATSTTLGVLVPEWAFAGGRSRYLKVWKDPARRAEIRAGIIDNLLHDRGGGDARRVVIVQCTYDSSFAGENLAEITKRVMGEPTLENVAETVLRLLEAGPTRAIYHCLSEEDVRTILASPLGVVASDGHTVSARERHPHPRNYGTFPRVLGHYVRELGVLTLAQAVHKMTGAVASRLDFQRRGLLRKGYWADVVVFDPQRVLDRATWDDPSQFPEGILHVLVNGVFVLRDGKPTGAKPGRALRRGET